MSAKGIILVTGSSRGIGAAMAIALSEAGYQVGCLSRKGELPQGMPTSLRKRFIPVRCDVTDQKSLRNAVAEVARLGSIEGLINNAGINLYGKSETFEIESFELVMRTNALGTFMACQEIYPYLIKSGGGLVINIGSMVEKLGAKYSTAYSASKAAVGAITRCLAVEWAKKNIRVITIAPGYILTDLTRGAIESGPLGPYLEKRIPRGKPGSPSEVAKLVTALFSSGITFLSGETIYIDGGQGIAH